MNLAVTVGSDLVPGTETVLRLVEEGFASRLFNQDASLWGAEATDEAETRLGWVSVIGAGSKIVAEAEALRRQFNEAGIDRIVLSGMGGSSLAPEVICSRDWATLTVLDSTHPDQVRSAFDSLARTALVVSSKSGSTVETRSHLSVFESAFHAANIDPSQRIVVVTDPRSALEEYAIAAGYRVFQADPNVGGRYSALTAFGLVPSVLAGADGLGLLSEAREAIQYLSLDDSRNPALQLAAIMAAQMPESYMFGAVETRVQTVQLPAWIEQLIAESTGKHGQGVLPIALGVDAPELRPRALGGNLPRSMYLVDLAPEPSDSAPATRTIDVTGPLGAQFLLWEVATAALCRLIGVNPFDQPDVESAKVATRAILSAHSIDLGATHESEGSLRRESSSLLSDELILEMKAAIEIDGYLAIQAYLDRATDLPLERLRSKLYEALGVAVSLGFGPRYLHSTGQLHKGGPKKGTYLQIIDDDMSELSIPGQEAGFAELIAAQAKGDADVLSAQRRPVFTIRASEVRPLIDEL